MEFIMLTEIIIATFSMKLTASVTLPLTLPAHRFVKLDGNLASSVSDFALGVSATETVFTTDTEKSNLFYPVVTDGIVLVESGGAITAGAKVFPSTAGKAVSSGTWPDVLPRGIAVDSATGAGELIRIKLI